MSGAEEKATIFMDDVRDGRFVLLSNHAGWQTTTLDVVIKKRAIVAAALRELRNSLNCVSTIHKSGICHGAWVHDSEIVYGFLAFDVMSHAMTKWPKYSGELGYPVPGVDGLGAEYVYDAVEGCNMYEGEYGQLRRELLDFLIEYLSDEAPLP